MSGWQQRGSRAAVFLSLAILLLVQQSAQAASNLQRELGVVAREIAKFAKEMETNAISMGEFRAQSQIAASAGPSIAQILSDEIRKQGVEVKGQAKLTVQGSYRDVLDDKTQRLAAQIQVSLTDRNGKELLSLDRGVFGDATLSSLFGATASLPPEADEKTRDQKLQEALDKPATNLRGPRISPNPESPYGIAILIKTPAGLAPRQPKNEDGLAYVPIQRDEIYAIRLYNDSPYEAAVTLSIDGLNVFCFSENKQYSQWVLPPKSQGTILGWHITNQGTDTFQVTEYSKSAAALKMPNSSRIGTITASFAAAWPKGTPAPPDEPPSPHEFARSADATGRGPRVTTNYSEVQRHFGVTRAAISARYTK